MTARSKKSAKARTTSTASTASAAPSHPPEPARPTWAAQRRVEMALRPSTPLEQLVTRALDQELEWYFAYAEMALHREDVGILPSYAAARILATAPTEVACRGMAYELAHTVQGCLRALSDRHASVLRSAYTPRRWPKKVEKAFESLAPLAVRLSFAEDPWPARSSRSGLEEAAANRLAAALTGTHPAPVARLKTTAQRLFGAAVGAYTKVRALEAPALGLS
jgi:hypothetical protein